MKKITVLEKVSFGLGDFTLNGTFTLVSSYLLFYYTDIAGIHLHTAGTILLLGRAVDALASLVAGGMIDKVNTKMGKCRPFLVTGLMPMIALMCGLFFMPDFSDQGKLLYGCVSYILFSCFYAFVNVPFSTMLSVLTNQPKERISLNVYKNFGANFGAVFVTLLALWLVKLFGGQVRHGYLWMAVFYAVFFLVGMAICIGKTKERVHASDFSGMRLREAVRIAAANRSWLVFMGIQCLGMLYMIIHNQGAFYYTKYYIQDESLNTILLALIPLMSIPCAFILPSIARKVKLHNTLAAGHLLVFVSLLATAVVGRNRMGVIILAVFTSLGWSMATGMIFVILSQLIDRTEKDSGKRPQGFMTSLMTFLMKMGVAAAGYVVPAVLKAGGYVADTQVDEQTIQAIRADFIYLPLLISGLVIGLCIKYGQMEKKATQKK